MTGELDRFIATNSHRWDAGDLEDLHFALDQLRTGAAADDSADVLQSLAYALHTPGRDTYPRNSDVIVHAWNDYGRALCPVLFAQAVRSLWKTGHTCSFLADPRTLDSDEYRERVDMVASWLDLRPLRLSPRRLMTNGLFHRDRDFWDSLPWNVTVYRGAAGVTPETVAGGLCWSTRRDIAEMFARTAAQATGSPPVVVTATLRKHLDRVLTVFSGEYEIVCQPTEWSQLAFLDLPMPRKTDRVFGLRFEDYPASIRAADHPDDDASLALLLAQAGDVPDDVLIGD